MKAVELFYKENESNEVWAGKSNNEIHIFLFFFWIEQKVFHNLLLYYIVPDWIYE